MGKVDSDSDDSNEPDKQKELIEKGGNILEESLLTSTVGLQTGPLDIALDEYNQIQKGIEIAPGEDKTPIPLYLDKYAEYKTFPREIPKGRFGFHSERPKKLSYSVYFKNRLMLHDARFGKNLTYLFWAMNCLQYNQLMSSINISLCKGAVKDKFGEQLTVSKALDQQTRKRWIVGDTGFRVLSQTRGSPAYWQKAKFDLLGMMRQLGVPTFFLTLSAADLHWPDVIRPLYFLKHGQEISDDNLENLSWLERADLLRNNPVIAARHFQQRLKSFFTQVLKAAERPIGKIIDYFYRIEFQMRGSPHIHSLLWVEDAPILGEDSEESICKFNDMFVSGQLPDKDLYPEDYELVKKLQSHKHTTSCQRDRDRHGNPVFYMKTDEEGNYLNPSEIKKK